MPPTIVNCFPRVARRRLVPLAALAVFAGACGDEVTDPTSSGPVSLTQVSGTNQSGVVGTELPQPLVVRAADSRNQSMRDVIVAFVVTGGGGSVFTSTVHTDGDGLATNYWTLGPSVTAEHTLEARTVGSGGQKLLAEVFAATALAGPAARITVHAGDGQTVRAGRAVPVAPAVRVTDQYGNPVPLAGVPVTFSVVTGAGTLTGATPNTDAMGIATIGSWILGAAPGRNTLTATAAGGGIAADPVPFTAWGAGGDYWLSRPAMPTPRYDLAAAGTGTKLYVVGGNNGSAALGTLEAFDIVTEAWTTKAPMPTPRSSLGAAMINGILYAVGGSGPGCIWCNKVEAYDTATNTWSTKAPMPTGRNQLAVAALNGILYAVGGQTQTTDLATLEAYDPATDTWTTKAPMPMLERGFGAGVVNGLLYAVGIHGVAVYDPVTNTWATKAPLPRPRSELGVGVAGGVLHAVGGLAPALGLPVFVGTVEGYDPLANEWTARTSMPTPRANLAVGVVGGVLYAVGGRTQAGVFGTVEAYVP